MRNLWETGILQRIVVLVFVAGLLGLSPAPYKVALGSRLAGRAQRLDLPLSKAKNLAFVAENHPWRADLWEQAGKFAMSAGYPETAIEYFKKAAAQGSLSQEGYLLFGDAYQQIGNPFTAGQIWEAAIRIYTPTLQSLNRLSHIQRESKNYPALINTLKEITQLHSQDFKRTSPLVDLYYELGMLLAAQEPASAPPYLLQAAELDPARKEASELAFTIQRALPEGNLVYSLVASGRKLADIGKWELAAYAFQRAVDLQPQSGEAWAFLGESLQHLENPANEKAYEALVEALDIDPGSLAPNVFMALYWQRAGKPDVAVEFLTAAVKIDPNNPDIFVDLGTAVAMAGDLETAHHHYWHAIELTYRHPVYLRELTRFYIQYNFNLQEIALPIAREIVQSDPTDPASLDIMGQVLFRLGDLYNAERFFIRAVNLDPNYAPAHLHLGLAYNLQDKTNLAKAAFARAISLAPGTQTAILAERFFDDADLRLENASP